MSKKRQEKGGQKMLRYATDKSVGLDLCSQDDYWLGKNESAIFWTGLMAEDLELQEGEVALVCSRSGLASNGIVVANSPGIIDPDYKGEIGVILHNNGFDTKFIKSGDRIAQLVILSGVRRISKFEGNEVRGERGDKGFGSTGV